MIQTSPLTGTLTTTSPFVVNVPISGPVGLRSPTWNGRGLDAPWKKPDCISETYDRLSLGRGPPFYSRLAHVGSPPLRHRNGEERNRVEKTG